MYCILLYLKTNDIVKYIYTIFRLYQGYVLCYSIAMSLLI